MTMTRYVHTSDHCNRRREGVEVLPRKILHRAYTHNSETEQLVRNYLLWEASSIPLKKTTPPPKTTRGNISHGTWSIPNGRRFTQHNTSSEWCPLHPSQMGLPFCWYLISNKRYHQTCKWVRPKRLGQGRQFLIWPDLWVGSSIILLTQLRL
jgi:hypothetical protein